MKEYRKRSDSGAVYDDPRVAGGAGELRNYHFRGLKYEDNKYKFYR
jgi:hypothetical protein